MHATSTTRDRRATEPAGGASLPTAVTWHSGSGAEVAGRLGVDVGADLTAAQAASRLARCGENRLAEKPPRSKWIAFFDQFKSLLILVLIGAALLAGAIGDIKDAVVILVVVLFNALLGFWQEHRAEATLAALKQMLAPVARVRRDGTCRAFPPARWCPATSYCWKRVIAYRPTVGWCSPAAWKSTRPRSISTLNIQHLTEL